MSIWPARRTSLLADRRRSAEHLRVARFCTVGATNTAVALVVYLALVHTGCPVWMASAVAFVTGAVSGYYGNSRWTFAGRGELGRATQVRYVAAQGMGTIASALGVTVAHDLLGLPHLSAELVTLPLVTALMYCLMRSVVFPRRAVDATAASA